MKILTIHASAGAGHTKAAEALHNGVKSSITLDAVIVDALDFTSPVYKKLYQNTYALLIKEAPWAWGWFFALADVAWLRPLVRLIRRCYNSINSQPLVEYLKKEQFDYILSTHFFPNEVAAALKRKGLIKSKIICAVTDFDVHSIWVADGIDHYAVACDFTMDRLRGLGVPLERILVSGIPTNPKFAAKWDKPQLKARLGVKDGVFTALLATGSFGMGPMEEVVKALADFQVIVVCGHNKELFSRLSVLGGPNLKVLGLVSNMHELMAVSDVMITKPGGLSISEALVSRLPLIFFSAIPGQETNNVNVLKRYGIGEKHDNFKEMVMALKRFSSSPSELTLAQTRTEVLAKPQAVSYIISLLASSK